MARQKAHDLKDGERPRCWVRLHLIFKFLDHFEKRTKFRFQSYFRALSRSYEFWKVLEPCLTNFGTWVNRHSFRGKEFHGCLWLILVLAGTIMQSASVQDLRPSCWRQQAPHRWSLRALPEVLGLQTRRFAGHPWWNKVPRWCNRHVAKVPI